MYYFSHCSSSLYNSKCDRIYEFDMGKIVASGSFDELKDLSPSFRQMINLQSFMKL